MQGKKPAEPGGHLQHLLGLTPVLLLPLLRPLCSFHSAAAYVLVATASEGKTHSMAEKIVGAVAVEETVGRLFSAEVPAAAAVSTAEKIVEAVVVVVEETGGRLFSAEVASPCATAAAASVSTAACALVAC